MKKPSRRDLLIVVGRLQSYIGGALRASGDRNPNRAAEVKAELDEAFDLCIAARSYDDPVEPSGPWANYQVTKRNRI
jgi:hypothetical protein